MNYAQRAAVEKAIQEEVRGVINPNWERQLKAHTRFIKVVAPKQKSEDNKLRKSLLGFRP